MNYEQTSSHWAVTKDVHANPSPDKELNQMLCEPFWQAFRKRKKNLSNVFIFSYILNTENQKYKISGFQVICLYIIDM